MRDFSVVIMYESHFVYIIGKVQAIFSERKKKLNHQRKMHTPTQCHVVRELHIKLSKGYSTVHRMALKSIS